MKAFIVTGTFKMRPGMQMFRKEVAAKDEKAAAEQVLSDLGSRHKVRRSEISIDSIKPIAGDEIKSMIVRHRTKA